MKTALIMPMLRRFLAVLAIVLMMPAAIPAQEDASSATEDRFSKEELTQMLAPIALYPDSLTAQVLMASTYPLEVVEAERWLQQNKGLKGEDLDSALKKKEWDPSVKSLCHFPDVLLAMSEKLDQTRKLGDAFLAQKEDVLATIQELRRKAKEQGNLKSTKEQTVIVEEEEILIEPAERDVVYVPVYDPFYVYGPWWYPAYPPYYWYWPPGYVTGAYIGFGPRIYIGFDLFSWVWFDWSYHRIHVDYNHVRRFHRDYPRRDYDGTQWRHEPSHRRGVAYRDRRTAEVFGTRTRQTAPLRPESRGYPSGTTIRQGVSPSRTIIQNRERAVAAPQTSKETAAGVRQRIEEQRQRLQPQRERIQSPIRRDTPFRGVGDGSFERRAVERGGTSIRSGQGMQGGGYRGDAMRPSGGSPRSGSRR